MGLYKGSSQIQSAYIGSTPIQKIYRGSTLLWSAGDMVAATSAFTLSGINPSLRYSNATNYTLTANVLNKTILGSIAVVSVSDGALRLEIAVDANTIEPAATTELAYGKILVANKGSFTKTYQPASFGYPYAMPAATGSYALSGIDINYDFGYLMPAAVDSIVLTGVSINATADFLITPAVDSMALTGTTTNLTFGYILPITAGSFALTGVANSFLTDKVMTASAGSFTLTGIASNFLQDEEITASAGSFALTGQAISFKMPQTWTLVAGEAAHWTLSNSNRTAVTTAGAGYSNTEWHHVGSSQVVNVDSESGLFYAEIIVDDDASVAAGFAFGVRTDISVAGSSGVGGNFNSGSGGRYQYIMDGRKRSGGTYNTYAASFTTGDRIGLLLNCSTRDLTFYKNGVSQGSAFTIDTTTQCIVCISHYGDARDCLTVPTTTGQFIAGAQTWN